jgi:hypothetical protein
MTARPKHNPEQLRGLHRSEMTKGQRQAAVRAGIIPPIRSDRERQLFTRYGMVLEDYDALLRLQGGLCAICRERPAIYVDHNHTTGAVRYILCPACNTLVGLIESDGWERVSAALIYVANGGAIIDHWGRDSLPSLEEPEC